MPCPPLTAWAGAQPLVWKRCAPGRQHCKQHDVFAVVACVGTFGRPPCFCPGSNAGRKTRTPGKKCFLGQVAKTHDTLGRRGGNLVCGQFWLKIATRSFSKCSVSYFFGNNVHRLWWGFDESGSYRIGPKNLLLRLANSCLFLLMRQLLSSFSWLLQVRLAIKCANEERKCEFILLC